MAQASILTGIVQEIEKLPQEPSRYEVALEVIEQYEKEFTLKDGYQGIMEWLEEKKNLK